MTSPLSPRILISPNYYSDEEVESADKWNNSSSVRICSSTIRGGHACTFHPLFRPDEDPRSLGVRWMLLYIEEGKGLEWMGIPLFSRKHYVLPLWHTTLTNVSSEDIKCTIRTMGVFQNTSTRPLEYQVAEIGEDVLETKAPTDWTNTFHRIHAPSSTPGLVITFCIDAWQISTAWRMYQWRQHLLDPSPHPPLWLDRGGQVGIPGIPALYETPSPTTSAVWNQFPRPVEETPEASPRHTHQSFYVGPKEILPLLHTDTWCLQMFEEAKQRAVDQKTTQHVLVTCTSEQARVLREAMASWTHCRIHTLTRVQVSPDPMRGDPYGAHNPYARASWSTYVCEHQPWRFKTLNMDLPHAHTRWYEWDEKKQSCVDVQVRKRLFLPRRICYAYAALEEVGVKPPCAIGLMQTWKEDAMQIEVSAESIPLTCVWVATFQTAPMKPNQTQEVLSTKNYQILVAEAMEVISGSGIRVRKEPKTQRGETK